MKPRRLQSPTSSSIVGSAVGLVLAGEPPPALSELGLLPLDETRAATEVCGRCRGTFGVGAMLLETTHPRGAPTRRTHAVTHVVHPRGVAANSNVPKRSQRVAGEVKSSALVNLQTGSNQMFGAAYRTETAVRPARKARAGDMARICRQCVRLTRGNQASHKVLLDQKLQMWKMSNTQFQLLSSHHDENNDENLMSFEHHFAY